ncbi:MAG: DNA-binding XRE family transcriptional regulator [Gammaproteobacteria bacterium]
MESKSPTVITEVLGKHLKQAWLNADTTQVELAEQMGISRKAFLTAEKGKVQFETLITIMKALQLTEQLKNPFRFKTSLQLNWLSYKGANDNELPNKKHQMCRSHLNGKAVVNVHYDDRVIGAVNFDTE